MRTIRKPLTFDKWPRKWQIYEILYSFQFYQLFCVFKGGKNSDFIDFQTTFRQQQHHVCNRWNFWIIVFFSLFLHILWMHRISENCCSMEFIQFLIHLSLQVCVYELWSLHSIPLNAICVRKNIKRLTVHIQ